MERQRSFSFKSMKFLVFSLTLSFSLLLLSFLFFWVMKDGTGSSVRLETYLKLERKPSVDVLGPGSVNLKPLVGLSANFSGYGVNSSNLMGTLFRKPRNSSGFAGDSADDGSQMGKNEPQEALDDGRELDPEYGSSVILLDEVEAPESEQIEEENEEFERTENGSQDSDAKETTAMLGGDDGLTKTGNGYNGNFTSASVEVEIPSSEKNVVKNEKVCDVSRGRWVFDESYPLYTNVSCPTIDEGFNCKGNGRLDSDYMRWRWQPQDCDIPRFNAKKMLEMIRRKRLVFVGDSINRNQWESMLCLLMGAVKDPKKVYETHGRRITKEKGNYSFRFVDYQCTVEFYVTHYLVHESKARVGQKRVPTLRIDSIDRGSSRWRGADILIFNTANWWSHSKTRAGTNYYQEGKLVHPKLEVLTAFRRALTTWATWVDRRVNQRRTRVFFRSSAPSHFRGGKWNTGGHCREARTPLKKSDIADPEKDRIATEVIQKMKTPVTILNVTSLSAYRIDGHPSIYGSKLKRRVQDCSHWCLPGVPDAWNELLYYHLLSEQEASLYSR